MKRTPLVMLPNGAFVRTPDVPLGGIIVAEPELIDPPEHRVIDQTEAVTGRPKDSLPKRAKFDVEQR